ncbi:hypothetical protein BDP27DRAFT_1366405 [Rhodocollybia butyracea]|uniref:Uncharacterized protein n=1 Tax=Rhodocollybia butyracea TaxID=206335 RepID=A0A9P5PKF4_9AGAR|nr:hypothetical protein BDP27DRAFT_1366405 [Rhodocollybia butyracea]
MYSAYTNITTQGELDYSSGSSSYSHQPYPAQDLSLHPRSTGYPACPSTFPQHPVLPSQEPLWPGYLIFAPEFQHLQAKQPDVTSPTSTYASSSSRSIAATAYTQPPRPIPHPSRVLRNIVRPQPLHSVERPVSFRAVGSSERGVQVFDLNIEPKSDTPLRELRDRTIYVHIVSHMDSQYFQWPGYESFKGRINLRPQSGEATRIYILGEIGRIIEKFFKQPPPRHRDTQAHTWDLMCLNMDRVVITRLVHCGGANWQPELWYLDH